MTFIIILKLVIIETFVYKNVWLEVINTISTLSHKNLWQWVLDTISTELKKIIIGK